MRSLSDTLTRLARFRTLGGSGNVAGPTRLSELAGFGSNPGALKGWTYAPAGLPEGAPLVVVLHGCKQTASGYDHGAGWSALADRARFAILFPEQRRVNNGYLCFNWFEPDDTRRDAGEALSIRQMIEATVIANGIDRRRVFIAGLSAGGAMTSVMLAAYPEVFAGGAIIAGLAYGVAATVPEAFDRMRGHGGPAEREIEMLMRRASGHEGPWPIVSIWHGSADATVAPSNSDALVALWRALHGLAPLPTRSGIVDGHGRRVWSGADGRELVEHFTVAGMGHGTPLATGGPEGLGAQADFMLEAGISSTRHIARFWGLISDEARPQMEEPPRADPPPRQAPPKGIGQIIASALRAAGLMK